MEGLSDLKVEQTFGFSDAGAGRSVTACSVDLSIENANEYTESNISFIEAVIEAGYEDKAIPARRAGKMRE